MIEKLNPDSQVVAKINELVAHINILEQKLFSAEEINTKSGSGLDPGININ